MKEFIELRINNKYIDLLPKSIIGKDLGPVTKIEINKNTKEYQLIKQINDKIKAKNSDSFFYGWGIKREYNKKELSNAMFFNLNITNVFEPTGEDCGTIYDDTKVCKICKSNSKQTGPLILKKGTIPKKDISITIGGEIVVSEKFVYLIRKCSFTGFEFSPLNIDKYFQLNANAEIQLSHNTIAGINPFDLSPSNGNEIYKCPKGHTIGLNLLSEAYILNSPLINKSDFLVSKQKIGVKRGFLRPQPLYFCSQTFKKMVEVEKLTGFEFEIANVV